jgi:hypothetical protein
MRRPSCLFAPPALAEETGLREAFSGSGFDVVGVSTVEELESHRQEKRCFVLFLDPTSAPGILERVSGMSATDRKFFWVAMDRSFNQPHANAYYQLGASDVLRMPVHPATLESRARIFLDRFLLKHTMPADVELPSGKNRHDPGLGRLIRKTEKAPSRFAGYTPRRRVVFERALELFRPKGRHFVQIEDPMQQQTLLRFAVSTKAGAMLWTPGRRIRQRAQTEALDSTRRILTARAPGAGAKLHQDRDADLEAQLFCSLRLGPTSVFFRSDFVSDEERIFLTLPRVLHEIQRRNEIRCACVGEPKVPLVLEIGKEQVRGFLRDFSAEGLCVEAAQNYNAFLPPRQELVVRWTLGDRRIVANATVCWTKLLSARPPNRERRLRLGLRFHGLEQAQREFLDMLVFESLEQPLMESL